MKKGNKKGGYVYYLAKGKIKDYSSWSAEKKLKWLSYFNKIRGFYPKKIIKKQEEFRKGEI